MRPFAFGFTTSPGTRIGVAIGRTRIRAVRHRGLVRPRYTAVAVEWDGERLAPAVDLVRSRLGRADAVAVAIDPDMLFVKHVRLPPVALPEQRRILMLEPERFFPLRGRDVVATPLRDSPLVFAADAETLETWLRTLEALGPVESVEPSPTALVRALVRHGFMDAAVVTSAGTGATVGIRMVAGALADARKVRGDWTAAAAAVNGTGDAPGTVLVAPDCPGTAAVPADGATRPVPMPALGTVEPAFAEALGALLGSAGAGDASLMPDAFARRARRRTTRRFAGAVAAAALALAFAVASAGRYRARVLAQLDREVATLAPRATAVLADQALAEQVTRRLALVDSTRAARADPLTVLLALTEVLPRDAHLRSIHAAGASWEIEGLATDAAQLVPALERSPVIADVRFRGATSRVRQGTRTYEDFSLAFRYTPAP